MNEDKAREAFETPAKTVQRWMSMIDYAYQCRDDIRSSSGETPRSGELRLLAEEMRAALQWAASQQAADGWISVHDRLPILPEDCEDDGVKVYTWDGEFVTEDVFEPQYEQPAGPAVGGWLRTGDWFCSDTATRVTHWMPRNPPAPPATQGGAE